MSFIQKIILVQFVLLIIIIISFQLSNIKEVSGKKVSFKKSAKSTLKIILITSIPLFGLFILTISLYQVLFLDEDELVRMLNNLESVKKDGKKYEVKND